jgi:acyl-CoA reductase-like NAD-dependent aldehyde dehydrogenase
VNGQFEYPSNLSKFSVYSPSEKVQLCEVKSADAAYVDYAVNIAHKTFESGVWSRSDVRARAVVLNNIAIKLRENIPRLAKMEVAQTGRAIRYIRFDNILK